MQEKRQNSIARNCDHEMEEEMRENGLRMDVEKIIRLSSRIWTKIRID